MSPRKHSRHTTYLGEPALRDIRGRLTLDNAARSASTEPYERRKPILLERFLSKAVSVPLGALGYPGVAAG